MVQQFVPFSTVPGGRFHLDWFRSAAFFAEVTCIATMATDTSPTYGWFGNLVFRIFLFNLLCIILCSFGLGLYYCFCLSSRFYNCWLFRSNFCFRLLSLMSFFRFNLFGFYFWYNLRFNFRFYFWLYLRFNFRYNLLRFNFWFYLRFYFWYNLLRFNFWFYFWYNLLRLYFRFYFRYNLL